MKRKRIVLICILLVIVLCSVVLAAGSMDDPLISVSWLYHTLTPRMKTTFQQESAVLDEQAERYEARMDHLHFVTEDSFDFADGFTPLSLSEGGTVTLDTFGCFLLTEGTARLKCEDCEIIDISTGELFEGGMLENRHKYFVAEGSGAVIQAYSAAEGFVDGYYRFAEGVLPAWERFTDIEKHWAKEQIIFLSELGAVNGVNEQTFAPDAQVTRAMFVTVLGRMFGADTAESETAFTDVKSGDWFAPFVRWASENGIVNGVNEQTFAPDQAITREQMAVILIRFCRAFGYELPETQEELQFADGEKISDWAEESVALTQRTGLMSGRTGGIFDPAGTATRAEMCAVLSRLYEKIH